MTPADEVRPEGEGEKRLVVMSAERAFHMRARAEAILEELDGVEVEWGKEARDAQEADAKDALAMADAFDSGITEEEADYLTRCLGTCAGFRPKPAEHELAAKLRQAFSEPK